MSLFERLSRDEQERQGVEYRSGHDWTVMFRDIEDNGLVVASLYGLMTARQVAERAHVDCGVGKESDILCILRDDAWDVVLGRLRAALSEDLRDEGGS